MSISWKKKKSKTKIRLLLRKPFNQYLPRHSSLSEEARLVNENNSYSITDWTKNSDIKNFLHELGPESNKYFASGLRD